MGKLFEKSKILFQKNHQIISYLLFGGLTTFVSVFFYFLASWVMGLPAWLSAVVSWIFAVAFAFATNKIFVFESQTRTKEAVSKEVSLFVAVRLMSLTVNAIIMFIFVDWRGFNEMLIFVVGQVIVLVFNYLASKFFVFK